MNIDVKRTVNQFLDDPKWLQKLIIGGLFYFAFQVINSAVNISDYLITKGQTYQTLPTSAVLSALTFKFFIFILMILLTSIPIGYVLESVHNQVNKVGNILPEWKDRVYYYFINGLKYFLIEFVFTLIWSVLLIVPITLASVVYFAYTPNTALTIIGISLSILLMVVIILSYLLIWPLSFIAFADKYIIMDAFNIKRFYQIIIKNLGDYVMCDLLVLATVIIQFLLSILLICTCIGILLIPFLYLPFFLIIMSLFTQVYIKAVSSV